MYMFVYLNTNNISMCIYIYKQSESGMQSKTSMATEHEWAAKPRK